MKIILFILLFSLKLNAQSIEIDTLPLKENFRPVVFERVQLETAVGAGISHIDKYYFPKPLISAYVELGVSIPLNVRMRFLPGINYQVFGSISNYTLNGEEITATRRLPYLSIQTMMSYLVSKVTMPNRFEVQGGLWGAKQLDDVIVNEISNQSVIRNIRNKSIESTVNYNYGLVLGAAYSIKVNQNNRLGFKLLLHQGILDIRTLIAKQNTGERIQRTQSLTLCTYLSL